ncbi:MAG TPA: hypothetical protein EYH32_00380 [Anaerolineae bacterium]|nr:hypothetical protein [Anaerolineae bacterium]
MAVRLLVGDRTGMVLGEIVTEIGPVSWRLNGIGVAEFAVARSAPAFREDWLRFGNRVLIEFDNGLPAWGGIIDFPREWNARGVKIKARGLGSLLKYRITAKTKYFNAVPVGRIFHDVLDDADKRQALGLVWDGPIWMGGGAHYPRYHFKSVWWVLTESIRKMENCDFRFVPLLRDGKIVFRPELHEVLGEDKRHKVALWEGDNVTDVVMSEQGPVINYVVVPGSGTGWGDDRQVAYAKEEESKQLYGLREDCVLRAGVTQVTTLHRHAEWYIREMAYPHTRMTLHVTNTTPARFSDYDVGDIVRVVLPSYGFCGYDRACRVLAREFDPVTGRCAVVLEERFAPTPALLDDGEFEV